MAADANLTLCRVILGLALCLPMLHSAAGAALDGTFDEDGTSRLTKYVLSRNILFNSKLGSSIQLTVNPIEISAAAPVTIGGLGAGPSRAMVGFMRRNSADRIITNSPRSFIEQDRRSYA